MLDQITSQSLLDQIGVAQTVPLAIKDLEHRFVHVNEAFADLCGQPINELIGKHDLDLGRPETLVLGDPSIGWPGLWALDDEAIYAEHTCGVEAGYERSSSLRTIRTALKDANGLVVGLMVQLIDVSEIKELKRSVASKLDALSMRDGEIITTDSVLASLLACQDTQTLLRQLANIIVERTSAEATYVAVMHESDEYMEFVVSAGEQSKSINGQRRVHGETVIGTVWESGEAQFLEGSSPLGREVGIPLNSEVYALPLSVDNVVTAVFIVVSSPASPDLSLYVALLERIAGIASIAIANTQLMDATAQALKRTHRLAEISRLLTTVDEINEAYNAVCHDVILAIDVTHANCYLLDKNGELRLQVSWGVVAGQLTLVATVPDELTAEGIVQWCVDNAESALINRRDNDPRESSAVHKARHDLNIGSTCCVPLLKQGLPIGAMLISRDRDRRSLEESEIDVFKAIVNQLSNTLERLDLQVELKHQAFHDRLTTLPNRHRFELELEQSINSAQLQNTGLSVLFIDLDGFKDVNDSYGHAIGDQLLSLVAERFSGHLKSGDVLARMGGDEFAVLLACEPASDEAICTALRLLDSLSTVFHADSKHLQVSASIGISQFPNDGATVDGLLRAADIAMYQAKNSGKGQIFCFDESLASARREQTLLEQDIRYALENDQFHLAYQPQVRCLDQQVVGLEALIRWQHPTRGNVPPDKFIPLAESTGLINKIGEWVINAAILQLADWQSTSLRDMRVSINIAASQFQLEDFSEQVLNALQRHGAPTTQLELEVTESVVMRDVNSVVERLNHLREAGVRIAIDDFGTGYSSLRYLQDLPLDVLKIDRSFVQKLTEEKNEQSLVKTILLLASGLKLETVAEGVETVQQRDEITRLGCDLIQGYFYSKPVIADMVPDAVNRIHCAQIDNTPALRRVG